MVLYDDKTELDLEKFDIYNQYRDQICYIKVAKVPLNLNMDPDNWMELKTIIDMPDKDQIYESLRLWFCKIAPDSYGPGKDFEFSDSLLDLIIEHLKKKFY